MALRVLSTISGRLLRFFKSNLKGSKVDKGARIPEARRSGLGVGQYFHLGLACESLPDCRPIAFRSENSSRGSSCPVSQIMIPARFFCRA